MKIENPLTGEIYAMIGDLSDTEIAWIDGRVTEARQELIEQCAVAAEAQDRIGREWVDNSLWANICKRAGANVRKLKSAADITFTPESEK